MIFVGEERLPTWAATMVREFSGGGEEAPAHILTAIAALDEVVAVATSVLEGRGSISDADRTSVSRDASTSLKCLGKHVQDAARPIVRSFQSKDLPKLSDLLRDVDGARRLASSASHLIDELCVPSASRCAWEDVVEAFRTDADTATCQLRIAQLRELCGRRGSSWDAIQGRVIGIMADRLMDAVIAGEVEADFRENPMAAAGLPLERRLEICRKIVGAIPVLERAIVWMAYGNADIPDIFVRKGPVQFFSHRLSLDWIRDGCPALNSPDFDRPVELPDPLEGTQFATVPDAPFVWVRVVVDEPHVADIAGQARQLASGLVEAADRGSEWVLLNGAAIFSDGEWWGSWGFQDPHRRELSPQAVNPAYDWTGQLLTKLDDRFVSALIAGDERAITALEQRRWEMTVAAGSDPAQRLALSMRILEHALPIARAANESVRDAAHRYLVEAWAMTQFGHELRNAAHYGIWSLSRPDGPHIGKELREAILPATGSTSFGFSAAAFINRVQDLRDALRPGTTQYAMVAEAADSVASATAALTHIAKLEARFRILLARTIRRRNAVIHGASTVPSVVATCEPFVRDLCGQLVGHTITAVSEGEALIDRVERTRSAWLRQCDALQRGKNPADVLFAGDLRER
jgi:hypothetical protein